LATSVSYDRWYRYDELTGLLRAWTDEFPGLMRVESIGTSYEGRDIWLVTVTNAETGPDLEKPAFLVEANIHAMEVTGCAAALHLIHRLLTGYGSDERTSGSPARSTRARSTSCPGSTRTGPSSPSPTGRGSCARACAPTRWPIRRTGCTRRTWTATAAS
jgi:hypothetical protein